MAGCLQSKIYGSEGASVLFYTSISYHFISVVLVSNVYSRMLVEQTYISLASHHPTYNLIQVVMIADHINSIGSNVF